MYSRALWLSSTQNCTSMSNHAHEKLDELFFTSTKQVMFSADVLSFPAGLHRNHWMDFHATWWKHGTWAKNEPSKLCIQTKWQTQDLFSHSLTLQDGDMCSTEFLFVFIAFFNLHCVPLSSIVLNRIYYMIVDSILSLLLFKVTLNKLEFTQRFYCQTVQWSVGGFCCCEWPSALYLWGTRSVLIIQCCAVQLWVG